MAHDCFYICCSDSVGSVGMFHVWQTVVKDSVLALECCMFE